MQSHQKQLEILPGSYTHEKLGGEDSQMSSMNSIRIQQTEYKEYGKKHPTKKLISQ